MFPSADLASSQEPERVWEDWLVERLKVPRGRHSSKAPIWAASDKHKVSPSKNTTKVIIDDTEPEKKMDASTVLLYTVAAVFYPEVPEGTVVTGLAEIEFPTIILEPTNVLARSVDEAKTRVMGKLKEGYVERQDGYVRFFTRSWS